MAPDITREKKIKQNDTRPINHAVKPHEITTPKALTGEPTQTISQEASRSKDYNYTHTKENFTCGPTGVVTRSKEKNKWLVSPRPTSDTKCYGRLPFCGRNRDTLLPNDNEEKRGTRTCRSKSLYSQRGRPVRDDRAHPLGNETEIQSHTRIRHEQIWLDQGGALPIKTLSAAWGWHREEREGE